MFLGLLLGLTVFSLTVIVLASVHTLPKGTEEDSSYLGDRHDPVEENEEFWIEKNLDTLYKQLYKYPNTNIAKNLILFIGDGMSLSTVTSARIYDGQRKGKSGENNQLSWETFPNVGLSKTYCVNKLVADSACTGTAYWTSVKNNYGTLGVTAKVKQGDCLAVNDTTTLKSILDYAQMVNKSTGIVTTTRVTHASPAAGYAHSSHRDYESDAQVIENKKDPNSCIDIATQLVTHSPGKDINVILGGGTTYFLPTQKLDKYGNIGQRVDGKDLVELWELDKKQRFGDGKEAVVWDVNELKNVNYDNITHLMGLFSPDHMAYNLEADRTKEPTLAEMTEAAIKVLKNNENGFLLFVESGKIDLGHHATQPKKALDETIEMNEAVKKALSMTNSEDTLIVVTSDHSHTMSISGYPGRGTDILKYAGVSDIDNMPYTILSYANGIKPGRGPMLSKELGQTETEYPSLVPMKDETHSGEDVAVYSIGPWSHLMNGVFEQTTIPAVFMFASCIGPSLTACNHYNFRSPTLIPHTHPTNY